MKIKILFTIIIFVTILFLLHGKCEAVTYVGSLSSEDGDITTTGLWADVTLTWTVTGAWEMGIPWTYEYELSSSNTPDINHVINELTNPFEIDIYFSTTPTHDGIQLYKPGGSNPNMPDDMYGIKFEGTTATSFSWTITTLHTPVWGDFYAKGGGGVNLGEAWNEGFSDPDTDPSDPASEGSIDNHLLVPDGIIPEPSTLILFLLGIMGIGLGWWRRRRR